MSEIAKCPCCGGLFMLVHNEGRVVGGFCKECSFSCDMENLYKISAAMELAKRHKELDNYKGVNPNIITDLVNAITVAEHNVLEVFK